LLPRVRAVSLFNYIEIAASVGLDPYRLLRDAQIDPTLLAHPENWLGARPVGDLLERSARDSDRDDFALLLAECRTFASLGPISLVLKHQETLGQVIARLQEYRTRLNDVIGLALAVSEDVAIVQWTVVPEFAGPQIECLVSAVGYRALTEAMGRSWKPECVHFAMARPVEIQSYQRFFQCDLHFGAPFNGLSFNAGQLDIRNRGSDPALAQHAERLLKLIPAQTQAALTTRKAPSSQRLSDAAEAGASLTRQASQSARELSASALALAESAVAAAQEALERALATSQLVRDQTLSASQLAQDRITDTWGRTRDTASTSWDAAARTARVARNAATHTVGVARDAALQTADTARSESKRTANAARAGWRRTQRAATR